MALLRCQSVKLLNMISDNRLLLKTPDIFRSAQLSSTMCSKPAVLATRSRETFPPTVLNELESSCSVTYWKTNTPIPHQDLLKMIKGKDALLCLLTDQVNEEVLQESDKLKVVATMSVGYDHLDLEALKERNIKVGYTPGVLTDATADLTVAVLLATSRRLLEGNMALKSGNWSTWSPQWMCGPQLSGSTVGIVGLGQIGRSVMLRLKPFGVNRFVYCGRSKKDDGWEEGAEFLTFDELLQSSDFVIITCSYAPDLHHMFNSRAFGLMKESSVLVNTSRGGVINQDDLVEALTNHKIFGAGLDVMTPEPLPTDHPLIKLNNCVLVPHLGSATIQTREKMLKITVENILAGLHNQPMPAQIC